MRLADLQATLDQLAVEGRLRSLRRVDGAQGPRVKIDGHEVLLFCSNDYLGLAADARVRQAAKDAIDDVGFGSGASRLISGNMAWHEQLEATMAEWFMQAQGGAELAALVLGSGYHGNTGLIPTIADTGHVISDELNHASIIDGIRLSKAEKHIVRHGDLEQMRQILSQLPADGDKLIVTDSVFSMDGDEADLTGLATLASEYDATLYVDEAHGVGVLGAHGSGLIEEHDLGDADVIRFGTLGKALGSFGAYAVAHPLWRETFINRARSVIFTTAPPAAAAAAAAKAIEIIRDEPQRRKRLQQLSQHVRKELQGNGFDVPDGRTPIIPVIIGAADETMALTQRLLERGIYVQGIRPPTVAEGTCRLRLTLSAAHDDTMIEQLLEAFRAA